MYFRLYLWGSQPLYQIEMKHSSRSSAAVSVPLSSYSFTEIAVVSLVAMVAMVAAVAVVAQPALLVAVAAVAVAVRMRRVVTVPVGRARDRLMTPRRPAAK